MLKNKWDYERWFLGEISSKWVKHGSDHVYKQNVEYLK